MAFEERVDQLTCPSCGAKHTVKRSRMPVREGMTVKCLTCGAVAFDGSTLWDYFEVKLASGA